MSESKNPIDLVRYLCLQDDFRKELANSFREMPDHENFEFNIYPISYERANPITLGVFRICIRPQKACSNLDLSLVAKVTGSADELSTKPWNSDPQDFRYWCREYLLHRSGFLNQFANIFHFPRCLYTYQSQGVNICVFEEISSSGIYNRSDLLNLIYSLGIANGINLGSDKFPYYFSQKFLLGWISHYSSRINLCLGYFASKKNYLPPSLYESILIFKIVIEHHKQLIALAERVGHVGMCHHDLTLKNIIWKKDNSNTSIPYILDWSFVGTGFPSEDLSDLLIGSTCLGFIAVDDLRRLQGEAISRLTRGLKDCGIETGEESVLYAYSISSILRWGSYLMIKLFRYMNQNIGDMCERRACDDELLLRYTHLANHITGLYKENVGLHYLR